MRTIYTLNELVPEIDWGRVEQVLGVEIVRGIDPRKPCPCRLTLIEGGAS